MKNITKIEEIQEDACPILFDSAKEKAFTSSLSKSRKIHRGERRLSSPSPEASRLAIGVINRLENPDSPHAWLARVKDGKRGNPVFTREKSLSMKQRKPLSLQEKQDVCQTVFFMLSKGIDPKKVYTIPKRGNPEKSEDVTGIALIFRSCRDLLRMNGGNHDISKEDSLDDVAISKPFSLSIPHLSEERKIMERLALAEKIRVLRKRAFLSFAKDPSRQKRQNLKTALSVVRHLCACMNPTGRLSPMQWENGSHEDDRREKMFSRFRLYLASAPASLSESLRDSMTALS